MTTVRMQRLDEFGALIGEPVLIEGMSLSSDFPNAPIGEESCAPLVTSYPTVSLSLRFPAGKELLRVMQGGLSPWQRRFYRHKKRIVVVPKRRRKHGRVGVYR